LFCTFSLSVMNNQSDYSDNFTKKGDG
jgi:hypothetical protein